MFKTRSGPDHGAQHLEHRSTLASSLVTQASLPRIAVRSDLWSLGVTLYELLTGECPFSGSAISVILDILRKAPRPPRRLDPSIPKDLEAICLKCLAKAPAQRYGTCADLADDLRRWLQGGPTAARPLPAAERGWRWSKRNPVFALCLVLLIGGLVTAVAYLAQTRPLHVGQDVMQTHDPQTKESALSAHGGWSASNGAPSRELGLTPAPFAKSEPGLPPIPTQPVNEQKSRNADVPPQKDEITVIIDRDLEYIPDRWPVGESYDLAPDLLRRPDKALVGEPQYRSREVWYGYLSFGNGPNSRFSYAIDGWDSGHWMMYVDKNRNQDLTDDGSPVSSDAVDQGVVLDLPVPVASVSGMAKTRPYRLWLRINTRDGKMTPEFCPRCHYRGQLVVQGKSYAVATVDRGNSHLDFTTADAFCSEHGLWIDVDGNGQFDPLMENFLDGEAIRIGNKDYVLRLFETDDGQLGLNDDSSPQMPAPIHVAIDRDLTYLPQGRSALTQSTIMKSSSPPGPVPVLTLIKEPVFKSQQVLYGNLTLGDGPLDSVRYVLDEIGIAHWGSVH